MKKYCIAEYSIENYKELILIYDLLMSLKKFGEDEQWLILCKRAMDIAREWIGTKNTLCFGEYNSDNVVILEFDCKPIKENYRYAKIDENGIYMESDE